MACVPSVTTTFPVRRGERKLVSPARPTPYEFKMLSDIDDQDVLRFYRSGAFFYRSSASKEGLDPAKVIRSADADLDRKALEAVRHWKFTPAIRSGQPVPVQTNAEYANRPNADARTAYLAV